MKMSHPSRQRRNPRLPVNGIYVALVAIVCCGMGYLIALLTFSQSDRKKATVSARSQQASSSPVEANMSHSPEVSASRNLQPLIPPEAPSLHHPKQETLPNPQEKGVFSYGRSQEGRPIIRYVLGNGSDVTLIFGAFHGDERNTKGVVEALYQYLQIHPEILAGHKVVLVPCANPDGWEAKTRVNANGVDINRNFPYHWQSSGRSARVNPGPNTLSEPESRAIVALMKKFTPSKVVSIHCPLHCLNWNGERGHNVAKAMHVVSSYPMTNNVGYPTPGSFGDYCEKQLGIGIVTLEMSNSDVEEAWRENRAALLAAISYSIDPASDDRKH